MLRAVGAHFGLSANPGINAQVQAGRLAGDNGDGSGQVATRVNSAAIQLDAIVTDG